MARMQILFQALHHDEHHTLLDDSMNNLGPNGNITGRRVKPCREE